LDALKEQLAFHFHRISQHVTSFADVRLRALPVGGDMLQALCIGTWAQCVGYELLCEGTAGGPQGSAITNAAFPILIDSALKGAEAKFTGVEVRGIQDDIGIYGDPELIVGNDGALMWLFAELLKADLEPNRSEFQAFTTTPDAYFDASPPGWLGRPFVITDPTLRAKAAALGEKATAAAAAAKHPSHPGGADEAKACAAEVRDFRDSVPEEHRVYGIISCGAATGDGAFVREPLLKEQKKLCGDAATGSAGRIASTMAVFAEVSAQSAATVTHYSLPSRVDFLLQAHLPSPTRGLLDAVDAALRRACKMALGKDLPDPEGGFPEQQDPTFTRDLMGLKTTKGGGGVRRTSDRMPFLNCLLGALQRMIGGQGGARPLWPSPSQVTGTPATFDKANEPEKRWLETFLGSGTRMAAGLQAEIARARALLVGALSATG
jgi:hypothetical protein